MIWPPLIGASDAPEPVALGAVADRVHLDGVPVERLCCDPSRPGEGWQSPP